nr:hypothetical protein [Streptomyces canus]
MLAQFTALPEEDLPCEAVASFGDVELGADHPPVSLVRDELEQVQGLEDPSIVGDRVTQPGRLAVPGEHVDQVVAADFPQG